jgi:chromosome segregation ATPase
MDSTGNESASATELENNESDAAHGQVSATGEPSAESWQAPAVEHESATSAMPSFLKDEIGPILAAAERAAAQIVDRAREQARSERAELERTRARVERRVTEIAAWQESVEPSIRSLQVKVADIQSKIDEVPELIRKALDPVATAISGLDPTLAEVASASRPVLHLEPLPTSDFGLETDS